MTRSTVDLSWGSLWRILVMAAFVYLLFLVRETIAILILALIISTAFAPMVARLEKWRVPRILGTVIVFLVALAAVAFVLYTILPLTLLQLNSLFRSLSGLAEQFLGVNAPVEVVDVIDTDLKGLTSVLLSGSVPFLQILGRLLGGVAFVIATLVISFYLTASRDGVHKFLRAILPEALEGRVLSIYERTRKKIGRWFQAQLFLSFVIGGLVFAGLFFLGVEQNLVLAVVAAVLELVPVVGPIFAGAFAVMVALGDSAQLAFYVLLFFVAIQQVENQLLVPLVMKKAVGVNPVMVLLSLLAGAQVAGIIGALIAVPIAVFLQELLDEWIEIKTRRSTAKLKV